MKIIPILSVLIWSFITMQRNVETESACPPHGLMPNSVQPWIYMLNMWIVRQFLDIIWNCGHKWAKTPEIIWTRLRVCKYKWNVFWWIICLRHNNLICIFSGYSHKMTRNTAKLGVNSTVRWTFGPKD